MGVRSYLWSYVAAEVPEASEADKVDEADEAMVEEVVEKLAAAPAAPPPPPPLVPAVLCAVPPAGYEGAIAAGVKKAELSVPKLFVLAILSGTHIAFGAYLALTVGADVGSIKTEYPGLQKLLFGAFGLPFGLFMTVLTGAELFTGNAALVPLAVLEGKANMKQLLKSLVVSWLGNLVGSLFIAWLVHSGGTLASHAGVEVIAKTKANTPLPQLMAKAIMCNWLVCMAVYMASFARDVTGKFVAIFLPISAFVTLGLEHTVANMFLIPVGMLHGAEVSVSGLLLSNLLPVTIGNIIGALIGVSFPFFIAFGQVGSVPKRSSPPIAKVPPLV